MTQKLAQFGQEIALGLEPSLEFDGSSLWDVGSNVLFLENSVTPYPGQRSLFPKPEVLPVRGMMETREAGEPVLYFATDDNIWRYRFTDSAATSFTRAVGGSYSAVADETLGTIWTRWSFAPFGNWVCATNGREQPQIYRRGAVGVTEFEDLDTNADNNFNTAEILVTSDNHLLAFNLDQQLDGSDGGHAFAFSDQGDPLTWTPAATNRAGERPILDLDGDIVAAAKLTSGIAVAGNDQLFIVRNIGGGFVFGVALALEDVGVFSKDAMRPVGPLIYGAGPRGLWRSDGSQVNYFSPPRIHSYIYEDMNRTQYSKFWLWHDTNNGLLVFFYCSAESLMIDRAVGYRYLNDTWHLFGFARYSGTAGESFPYPVVGGLEGDVLHIGVSATEDSGTSGRLIPIDEEYVMKSGTAGEAVGGFGKGQFGFGFFGGRRSGP